MTIASPTYPVKDDLTWVDIDEMEPKVALKKKIKWCGRCQRLSKDMKIRQYLCKSGRTSIRVRDMMDCSMWYMKEEEKISSSEFNEDEISEVETKEERKRRKSREGRERRKRLIK